MDVNMILEIVKLVGCIVLGGLTLYFKYNTKLNSNVAKLIKEAEEEFIGFESAGSDKFNWVVEELYKLIPTPLNLVFTKETIKGIVQRTFDEIQEYAKTQLDKVVDKVVNEESE